MPWATQSFGIEVVAAHQVLGEEAAGLELGLGEGQRPLGRETRLERDPEKRVVEVHVDLAAARPDRVPGVVGAGLVIEDLVHAAEAVDEVVIELVPP